MTASDSRRIAERFVEARLQSRALPDYPGDVPATMSAAYAVQDQAIDLYPGDIAGWKVGGVPPELQPALGVHRLAGAIFARNVWAAQDGVSTPLPVIPGGFGAVEAEFVVRIGVDADPAKLDWSVEDAAEQIDTIFIGVELAASPLASINALGSAVVASDFGNNGGLLVGAEVPEWRDRLAEIWVETIIDGVSVGRARQDSLAGGALESVRFLLEHCARWGRPLKAGTLISTGAVTGVHETQIGSDAVCIFEGVGEIRCSVVRAGG